MTAFHAHSVFLLASAIVLLSSPAAAITRELQLAGAMPERHVFFAHDSSRMMLLKVSVPGGVPGHPAPA